MYEVVNVKTREEWDFVSKCLNFNWSNEPFNTASTAYDTHICINITTKQYSPLSYYMGTGDHKVYSFEEWCKMTNNYPEKQTVTDEDLSYLSKMLINMGIQ